MKKIFIYILIFSCSNITAQVTKKYLTGDWKVYLEDSATFEFLRLKSDGTGLKCLGQTINGKDTLFVNHISALTITNWKVEPSKLIIQSDKELTYKINPEYNLLKLENDRIQLQGEHLKLGVYPSILNKETFYRIVIFQKADKMIPPKGIKTEGCIMEQTLFKYTPIDENVQRLNYIGFNDIIPWIIGCNTSYEHVSKYNDPPYTLEIPVSINTNTFGFGSKQLTYSLESKIKDSTESAIDIYYDFDDSMKNHFLSQMQKGKTKVEIVKLNGHDIYTSISWQGKYTGQIFLGNSLIVAYYTRSDKKIELLQKCIASFKYQ